MVFTGIIKHIDDVIEEDNEKESVYFTVSSKNAKCQRNKFGQVMCFGSPDIICSGMTAEFEGEISGKYVQVTSAIPTWIDAKVTANFLLKRVSKRDGFSKAMADKIVEAYGEDLFSISEQDLQTKILADFPELSKYRIAEKWCAPINPYIEIERFLNSVNVTATRKQIRTLYEAGGSAIVAEIKTDPWQHLRKVGMTRMQADIVGEQVGIKYNDPRRIIGWLAYALVENEANGNEWALSDELLPELTYDINHSTRYKFDYNQSISEIAKSKHWPIVYADFINAATDNGLVCYKNGSFFFRQTFEEVSTIASQENAMLREDRLGNLEHANITDADIDYIEKTMGIKFSAKQRSAFELLNNPGISVLTGGPGTGKTTIVRGLIAMFERKFSRHSISLCAPTGRASKRLAESTGRSACTIHKLLHIRPGDTAAYSYHNGDEEKLAADLIIVDESSMLDTELMSMLMESCELTTRVLLVGDVDQLPSVGAGNVLEDMFAASIIPIVKLDEVFRQGKQSGIVTNAVRIRTGRTPVSMDDFTIRKFNKVKNAEECLYETLRKTFDINDPYKTQVLTMKNDVVDKINKWVHRNLMGFDDDELAIGDKIMFQTNVYESDGSPRYLNGECGIIVHMNHDEIHVQMDDDSMRIIPYSAHRDMRMAYACTVHKSQGSEYDNVIIYANAADGRMLTRNIFYTAVTRAKQHVYEISQGDADKICVNTESPKRRTFLWFRLMELTGTLQDSLESINYFNETDSNTVSKGIEVLL